MPAWHRASCCARRMKKPLEYVSLADLKRHALDLA
jgi:hypothetical protein